MARRSRSEIGGHDLVAAGDQRADQVMSDLPARSGEEDLHEARIIHCSSSGSKAGNGPGIAPRQKRRQPGFRRYG
jgi:hypothetical protein